MVGEPPEIYPDLGTSRLEEPLIRWPVRAVVHGHAHRGTHEGRMVDGTPVCNVALPLLQRLDAAHPGFRVLTLRRGAAATGAAPSAAPTASADVDDATASTRAAAGWPEGIGVGPGDAPDGTFNGA